MVEGPGCTRNGEKLRRSVVGHRVVGVAGGAGPRVAPSIRGKVLIDAMTLGKQLWMIFGDETGGRGAEVAVRCHFGMAGSLHCGEACQTKPELHGRKQLTLFIRFEASSELRLHDSSAVLADAAAAREAVSFACARDVCSPSFDVDTALAHVARAPGSWMISDVLLDQNVLPGVGNIIKNEALHRSGTDPRQPLNGLSQETLACIVREVRAFSAAWCRSGRQPPCKVYNRTACAACGAPVSFCKLGEVGSPRPTFWCTAFCGLNSPLGAIHAGATKLTSKRKWHGGGGSGHGDGDGGRQRLMDAKAVAQASLPRNPGRGVATGHRARDTTGWTRACCGTAPRPMETWASGRRAHQMRSSLSTGQ